MSETLFSNQKVGSVGAGADAREAGWVMAEAPEPGGPTSVPSLNSIAASANIFAWVAGRNGRILFDLRFPCQLGSCRYNLYKSSLCQLARPYNDSAFVASLSLPRITNKECGKFASLLLV